MGGTKLGLISYEARGFLHVRGVEMAWAGLRQLWGTREEGGIFLHHPELLRCHCTAPCEQRPAVG